MLVRALCALLLTVIGVLGTANAASAAAASPAPAGTCTAPQDCRGHGAAAASDGSQHTAPLPCLRDAGCGGGAFALGGAAFVVGVLPAAVGLVSALRLRTRRVPTSTRLGDRLSAGRLYRPPRLSF